VEGADHCEDWTESSSISHEGFWGHSAAVNAEWTFDEVNNPIGCGVDYAIYCFQEP
jgi:hypothetical protein